MPQTLTLTPARESAIIMTLAGLQFSHILDFMIMMPLGPILMSSLGISTVQFGLLVSSYSFAAAASGICGAGFIDRFERKRLLLTLFIGFIVATAACGVAPNYVFLMIARACAGIFGGVLGALVQTIAADVIPFERRGRAMGALMTAFSLSTVAGVPVSLFLAHHFGWRAPFFFIAIMASGLLFYASRTLPIINQHLIIQKQSGQAQKSAFAQLFAVLRVPNHLRALGFMLLLTLSSFLIVPYITIYLTNNVGVTTNQLPYVYLLGGSANWLTARVVGRLTDKYGKVQMYRTMALLSMIPLLTQTHISPMPFPAVLACTTLFFMLIPTRMIPAMSIITSSMKPELRGTFMSLNSTTQSLASGSAAFVTGLIVATDATGKLLHYNYAGYLGIACTLAAMWLCVRIKVYTSETTMP